MIAPADTLAAKERIELLLDPDSFIELGQRAGSVITGGGTIDDRPVCLFSQDGTAGQDAADKIAAIFDLALKTGCPLIGIYSGTGERSQQGASALGRYGEIFRRSAHASGVVPQLSLVVGTTTGVDAFLPALSDFLIMVEQTSQLFVSGPEVVKAVTGENVSPAELGAGLMHATTSGVAHYLGADEVDAIDYLRNLLSYLPQNNLEDPPGYEVEAELAPSEADRTLDRLIPPAPIQRYDMQQVIATVLDDGEFCEVQERFARNIVVGYGRIEGRSVGVVANQPLHFAGCLDTGAAEKAARFIRTCDAFNTPVVTFVDAPGFLPGTDQEWHGISRHLAKLIYAYAEATVPLVTVITRRASGGAYEVMAAKQLGADICLAWPTAQIGAAGGQEPASALVSPESAAEQGHVDALIMPHRTRSELTRALRLLRTKRATLPPKKHGNIPL